MSIGKDYKDALVQIDVLWDAAGDTPDGDQLDVLCDLVAVYEAPPLSL